MPIRSESPATVRANLPPAGRASPDPGDLPIYVVSTEETSVLAPDAGVIGRAYGAIATPRAGMKAVTDADSLGE